MPKRDHQRRYPDPNLGTNSDFDETNATITPAQIIRSCLIDFGLVSYPGRDPEHKFLCYFASMPDAGDYIVRVTDTVGRLLGRGATGKNLIQPGVMILVRSKIEEVGYLHANKIVVALDQQAYPIQTTVPDNGYVCTISNIHRTSPVIQLGEEVGKKRFLFTIDTRITFDYDQPLFG